MGRNYENYSANAKTLQNCSYAKLKLKNRSIEVLLPLKSRSTFIGPRGSANIRAANSIKNIDAY